MLRLAFDFIIAWRETRTRPNAYICPLMQRCTLEIHRACFDSFVEGFKKGARAAEKEINKKFKTGKK